MSKIMLTREQVADLLGTSISYLASKKMRYKLTFFKDHDNGRVLYDKDVVDAFIAAKMAKKSKIKRKLDA